jgi:hypothetical protein
MKLQKTHIHQALSLLPVITVAVLAALTVSMAANAADAPVTFEELTAPTQVQTSRTACNAYTTCHDYYGNRIGQISCGVYGYQYFVNNGLPVPAQNSCTWFVRPYVSVQCTGFQQARNPYTGQFYWAWQNFQFRCPGR